MYKIFNKKGKYPTKLINDIPWNKICVDLIGPLKKMKVGPLLIHKFITIIDPARGWFKIIQCVNNKNDDD